MYYICIYPGLSIISPIILPIIFDIFPSCPSATCQDFPSWTRREGNRATKRGSAEWCGSWLLPYGMKILSLKPVPSYAGWWFGTFFIFPYIGNLFHHPKWLSLIFFRGVGWNHQPVWIVFGFRISQNHPLSGAKDEQIPYESYEKPWLMGMLGHSTLRGISLPRQTSQDVKPAGLQPSLWPM